MATARYLQKVRQVLRSQLNKRHKLWAISTYALPVIRYPASIHWLEEEIEGMYGFRVPSQGQHPEAEHTVSMTSEH